MNVSPNVLRKETVALIRDIDKQIDEAKKYAASLKVDDHTVWVMPQLLQAKATAYNTLVLLQDK